MPESNPDGVSGHVAQVSKNIALSKMKCHVCLLAVGQMCVHELSCFHDLSMAGTALITLMYSI